MAQTLIGSSSNSKSAIPPPLIFPSAILSIAACPATRDIAVATTTSLMILHNGMQGRPETIDSQLGQDVLALTPDGSTLVVANNNRVSSLFLGKSKSRIIINPKLGSKYTAIAVSPTSQVVAIISENKHVGVHDVRTLAQFATMFKGWSPVEVSCMTFMSEFEILAASGNAVYVWDYRVVFSVTQLSPPHQRDIVSVAATATGDYLASGSIDNTIQIYYAATRQCTQTVACKNTPKLLGFDHKDLLIACIVHSEMIGINVLTGSVDYIFGRHENPTGMAVYIPSTRCLTIPTHCTYYSCVFFTYSGI